MSLVTKLLPGIDGLLGRFIEDPNKRRLATVEIEKSILESEKAGLKAAQGMMENKSPFVAGAIPSLIWLASIMLLNNHVLLPWAAVMGHHIPTVTYPSEYWYLLGVIITGLFAKKSADKGLQLGTFKTSTNQPSGKPTDERPDWI